MRGNTMTLKCAECDSDNLSLIIHEMKEGREIAVYSAIMCNNCGMIYPITHLGSGPRNMVNREVIMRMLRAE